MGAEARISLSEPEEQLALRVIAEVREVGRLYRQHVFVVGNGRFEQWSCHIGRHAFRSLDQRGTAGNQNARPVRTDGCGFVHFLDAAPPELTTLGHVALLERLSAAHEKRRAMPDHGFGMPRILRKGLLAEIDHLLKPFRIASYAGEEVGTHEVVEPLGGRLGGRLTGGGKGGRSRKRGADRHRKREE